MAGMPYERPEPSKLIGSPETPQQPREGKPQKEAPRRTLHQERPGRTIPVNRSQGRGPNPCLRVYDQVGKELCGGVFQRDSGRCL